MAGNWIWGWAPNDLPEIRSRRHTAAQRLARLRAEGRRRETKIAEEVLRDLDMVIEDLEGPPCGICGKRSVGRWCCGVRTEKAGGRILIRARGS